MTWEEAMRQAHEEVMDNLANLDDMNLYCSGWLGNADSTHFSKEWPIDDGSTVHVEINLAGTYPRVTYLAY